MVDLKRYQITFSAHGIGDVVVLHNSDPVTVSGYGGWTVTARQRRVSLTEWQGKDPLRMSIPILFDGVRGGVGQEIPITRLSRMALPPEGGGEPPVITIKGLGVPKPGPKEWVIESIDWGSNVMWDTINSGVTARVRQDAVVHVMQYVADDRVSFANIKLGSQGTSKTGWPKTYVVKAGDTLGKIAVHFYHDVTKWKKIADANGIRDPKNLSKYVHKTIRIPKP